MRSTEQIERRARQLLAEADITSPDVDVKAVAKFLGAIIRRVEADEDISGALVREDDQLIIGINRDHPVSRRRFTIAHEIGHIVLHDAEAKVDHRYAQAPRDGIRLAALRSRVSSEAVDPQEIEANRFAASLLMPAHFLEQSLRTYKLPLRDGDISKLATEYRVSVQAMNYRLMNLGIPVDVAGQ
jgi:Zn-dependent peptidase ImmA (M78 family)